MSEFNKLYQLMRSLQSCKTQNYTLEDIRKEVEAVRKYLNYLHANPGEVVEIKWNNRFTRVLGRTTRKRDYTKPGVQYKYILEFNPKYFKTEVTEQVRDTIWHECIHLCENCFDHGKNFKLIAEHFNDHFGTNIERVNRDASQYHAVMAAEKPKTTHEVYCNDCGRYLTSYKNVTQKLMDIAKKSPKYLCPFCNTHNMRVTNLTEKDYCRPINLGTIRI